MFLCAQSQLAAIRARNEQQAAQENGGGALPKGVCVCVFRESVCVFRERTGDTEQRVKEACRRGKVNRQALL